MREIAKSSINQHTFDHCDKIRVNGKVVVKTWIDNKHMYFIETRDYRGGPLRESVTVTSLEGIRKAV